MLTFAVLCILASQDNDCPNPTLKKNTHTKKMYFNAPYDSLTNPWAFEIVHDESQVSARSIFLWPQSQK